MVKRNKWELRWQLIYITKHSVRSQQNCTEDGLRTRRRDKTAHERREEERRSDGDQRMERWRLGIEIARATEERRRVRG